MLTTPLIHPTILESLGAAGHGSKVLITDGNFPASTTLGENAELVHLNLAPGKLSATEVLEVLVKAVPIEGASVMQPLREGPYAVEGDPPVWDAFRKALPGVTELEQLERFAFYDTASGPEVCLTIQTGEQRIYANLLLTIGVVQ